MIGNLVVRDPAGNAVAPTVRAFGDVILLLPPSGGWAAGAWSVELHGGIQSLEGKNLTTTLALPFTSQNP